MLNFGYTIGASRWTPDTPATRKIKSFLDPIKVWTVPFIVSDEEIAEHVFAGGVKVC